jgi:hypothetical protein
MVWWTPSSPVTRDLRGPGSVVDKVTRAMRTGVAGAGLRDSVRAEACERRVRDIMMET